MIKEIKYNIIINNFEWIDKNINKIPSKIKNNLLLYTYKNEYYLPFEALLDGTSVLKVFRTHYKADKSNINNLEAYYRRLYIKLKEKEEMKKKFLSETLPQIKEANKRREAAYLAAIDK